MIDLVSDTATKPTAAMLATMARADVGDEQKGEDPTTRALEERVAALLGKERALLVPSATMANQIALALHVEAGGEVVAHRSAHVVHYEGGGTAIIARAQPYLLDTPRGLFTAEDVRGAIRADDPHHPRTRCVVIENTSNGGGGVVWPRARRTAVYEVCAANGVAVHVDGARLWNAHIASGEALSSMVDGATTVQACFSKGLGCPFGAVLALPQALWPRARRLKQALGGALRQSGVLAAAMNYALDHHLAALTDDHARAQRFTSALKDIGVAVEPTETNLVFFVPKDAEATQRALLARGLRVGAVARTVSPGPVRLRACFHRDINDAQLEDAVRIAREVMAATNA